MKKVYYLKTCSTCTRILKTLNLSPEFVLQDIKKNPITPSQLKAMHAQSGSYEALFNKRAKRYKELGLSSKVLSETDYEYYLLEHYTFLKRPVIWIDDALFIGNAKTTIAAVKAAL